MGRVSLVGPLLRLRSDEQLIALFRAGNDDAFGVIHDRYRQRLFAYVRQMLSAGPRQDAEDVLQDVFVRAFAALRADRREVNLRAWLYRVAHNRCIDHLRRPTRPDREIFEVSRKPLHDPVEEAQRREHLRRLVVDVGRLPDQQRSALLMREMDGMSYAHLADALDVTVPAVKSLLVRARMGLVEAAEARDTDCNEIRHDLLAAYDRGVKASGRARRHMRECGDCREYRTALRGMRRSFAVLSPVAAAGPLAVGAKLLGLGGAGGGAAAGGSAVVAGGGAAGGGLATATACKVAAVVCGAALTAGGAVEVRQLAGEPDRPARSRSSEASSRAGAPEPASAAAAAAAAVRAAPPAAAAASAPAAAADMPRAGDARRRADATEAERSRRRARERRRAPAAAVPEEAVATAPATELPADAELPAVDAPTAAEPVDGGGVAAPEDGVAARPEAAAGTESSPPPASAPAAPATPAPAPVAPAAGGAAPGAETGGTAPPG